MEKEKMKEFKVGLFYEVSGYSYIKARTQEKAEAKGLALLEKLGETFIDDVTHRDYYNV